MYCRKGQVNSKLLWFLAIPEPYIEYVGIWNDYKRNVWTFVGIEIDPFSGLIPRIFISIELIKGIVW